MKTKLLYLLFLISPFCEGQNQSKIDSLKLLFTKTPSIEEELFITERLFDEYISFSLDSANVYQNKYNYLSKNTKDKRQLIKSYILSSHYYFYKNKLDSAISLVKKSIDLSKNINNQDTLITSFFQKLSVLYERKMDYNNAEKYANLALEKAKTTNNWQVFTDIYISLGNIYSRKNNFDTSIRYYLKVDSIYQAENKADGGLALTYENISLIYIDLKDELALSYIEKSKKIYQKINDDFGINYSEVLKGLYFQEINEHNNALLAFEKVLVFFTNYGETYYLNDIYTKLGNSYSAIGEYKKAEMFFIKSTELLINTEDKSLLFQHYLQRGEFYLNKNKYQKAITFFQKADSINITNEASFSYAWKKQITKGLSEAYFLKKDYKNAYIKKKQLLLINDSLNKLKNTQNLQALETKYQTKKKDKEIELLEAQKIVSSQQKTNQRNIFLSIVSVISIIGLFLYYQYQNKLKTTKKLKELDIAKTNFYTNISHEFRTPLTLISGPIQKKLKDPKLPKKERESLKMMQRNSKRLLTLVDQLLDISKLESGELHLSVSENNLLNFIGILTKSFSFSAKQKNINYLCYINKSETITWYDSDIIEKIVVNLLSNAFKYTPENGSIVCNSFIKNNEFYFEVKNTGEGLESNELNKIFDKFYQINKHQQGAGIGLSLVKELVNLHKGTINVKNILNKWTTFEVILPIDKNTYNETEISVSIIDKNPHHIIITKKGFNSDEVNDENTPNDEQPILLIVDDNNDIRDYIENIFKESYSIIKAKDGEEGTKIALKQIPDIIISDIMMPVKNGIELCKQLKKDERTSHIPILLLTAKTGDENELEGIKTGADDYITKPFNEDLLIIKIDNIVKSRKKLQERFSQEIILKPKEITINSVDEKFLHKIQKVLDNKLIESSFNIEEFSKAIGMSRMQLHRKLKALTGLSASEFIRSQRLKLAISLLNKSDCNVSEIGYSVGFNNHAYFSKCFKEAYKCSPTEYLEKRK